MATLGQAAGPPDLPNLPTLPTKSHPSSSNDSKTKDTSTELYLIIDADGKPRALTESPNAAKNSTSAPEHNVAPSHVFDLPPDLAVHLALASHNLPADQLARQFNTMLRQVYVQTLLTMRRSAASAQPGPQMAGFQQRPRPVGPQGVISPEGQQWMGLNLPPGSVVQYVQPFQVNPGQPQVQTAHGNLNGHAAQPFPPQIQAQRMQQIQQHLHNQQQQQQPQQQQQHQHQQQHQQAILQQHMQQHMAHVQAIHQMHQQAAAQGAGVQPFQQVQVQVHAAQAAPPRNPAARREEMRDILAPFVRVLWAVLRILFVLYFFHDPSRSIWRVMALVGLGVAIYAIQTGMLVGLLGDRLEWARRYLDEVLGGGVLAAPAPRGQRQNQNRNRNGHERAQVNGQAQQPGLRPDHAVAPNTEMPDPRAVAERLVANRQAGNQNWVLQRLHAVERVLVLFLASLWPGIGEQAVRVQNEREEAERRRIREEEERRLEAERLEQEQALENASTLADDGQTAIAEDEVQDEWVDEVDLVNVGGSDAVQSSGAIGNATGVDVGEGASGNGPTRVNRQIGDGDAAQ
jgi:hypothetical protein